MDKYDECLTTAQLSLSAFDAVSPTSVMERSPPEEGVPELVLGSPRRRDVHRWAYSSPRSERLQVLLPHRDTNPGPLESQTAGPAAGPPAVKRELSPPSPLSPLDRRRAGKATRTFTFDAPSPLDVTTFGQTTTLIWDAKNQRWTV